MKGTKIALIITLVITALLATYIVVSSVGILNFGAAEEPNRVEGAGYDSPEECVEAYMEYFKNGDYNGMLSCYAIETAVENFSMEKYIERLQAINPSSTIVIADDDFSKSVSAEQLRYRIFNSIRGASWYLADCSFLTDGMNVQPESDQSLEDFVDEVLPSGIQETLSNIEYNGMLDENDEFVENYYKDQTKKNAKGQAAHFGSDDFEPVAVDFSVGKDDYYLFLDMLEYNEKWYIKPDSSFLSSIYGIPYTQGNVISQEDAE